ncbi:MAG: hypothetical protein LBL69_04345 [Zoogloeaceae bacterium]|jgi:hypothetical protein|nr:hypothetical protein [Zoogloeaceae bacterium]
MTSHDLNQSDNPDLRASLVAMQRAAQMARQTAIATNTAIVIVQDGKLRRITAEELKREAAASK